MHARYLIQNTLLLILISLHHSLISFKGNENCFNPTLIAVDSCGQSISRSFDQCSNETNTTVNRVGMNAGPASFNGAGQMPSHLANVSPAERVQMAIAYAYRDAYCRQHFHMSLEQKQKLMSCWRYKTFTKKLLEYNNLEDDIAWELWHEFVQSKMLHGDDLYECENVIRNEIKKRSAGTSRTKKNEFKEQRQDVQRIKIQKGLQKNENVQQPQVVSDQQKDQSLSEQKDNSSIARLRSQRDILQDRMRSLALNPEQCLYLPLDFDHVRQEYERCMNICDQIDLKKLNQNSLNGG